MPNMADVRNETFTPNERTRLTAGISPKPDKKARKVVRELHRPPDARERNRNLWETVSQARNLIELADHKARYALVVMGVANAAVFLLATRSSHFIQLVPELVRPWLFALLVPFGVTAVAFLVDAYNSLKPRPPSLVRVLGNSAMLAPEDRPQGLLFWDILLQKDLSAYEQAWTTVHMGQLNSELAAMVYCLASSIHAKYAALRRLYLELLIIILLTAVILGIPMAFGLLQNGLGLWSP